MDNKMEKLIELVKKTPYLYDKRCPGYKNFLLKEKTWKEIAKTLGTNETKCKSKWKGLRDSFFREIKKQSLTINNEIQVESKWKYYKNMRFLRTVPQAKRTKKNVEQSVNCFDLDELVETDFIEDEQFPSLQPSTSTSNTFPELTENSNSIEENLRHFLNNILLAIGDREDSISLFFKSAAEITKNACFTHVELIHLQMEILALIKSKIESKIKIE